MNEAAAFHSNDYPYIDPVDSRHLLFRFRLAREDDSARVYVHYGNKYLFQNKRHRFELGKKYLTGRFAYYEGVVELDDQRVGYVFEIAEENGKKHYFSQNGLVDEYSFFDSYKDYLQFPYVHDSDCINAPSWVEQAVFYQIFPDRFRRMDFAKDDDYIDMKWGSRPTRMNHAGGDIKGIIASLDYLSGLGINAIYLTPIFTSPSNHKYDTVDYLRIDPQFGTEDDLKELIGQMHARGMRLVLDAVYNHMSFFAPPFQDVVTKGRQSPYEGWFMLREGKPDFRKRNYETFSTAAYMPKIDVDNQEAEAYLRKVTIHYLKLGIDGWRLDVGDEISHRFWRRLHDEVKAKFPNTILLGENWHFGPSFLRGDEFDGMMNYPFYYLAVDYLAERRISAAEASSRLNEIYLFYRKKATKMMLNLLDSHDTARFLTVAKDNVDALECGLALMFFHPGMSCIYYGTEIPMEGGLDPDCRRCFPYEKALAGSSHQELLKKLIALRKTIPLSEGDYSAHEENGLLVIHRRAGKKALTLRINATDEVVPFAGGAIVSYRAQGGSISPFGFVISES